MSIPKVSVIIPVYKVEKYIERCAHSLFSQTLDEMEFIFVNDKTPDHSIEMMLKVLEEYPHRKSQLKLLEMPVNSKVAAARETGMKVARGEYMIHCDPDDWVENKAYEIMYMKAKETNADIVTCGFYEIKNGSIKGKRYIYTDLTPKEILYNCKFDWTLWNKLIRSNIIRDHNIYPYRNINSAEDLNILIRVFNYSKKIVHLNEFLYYYNRDNIQSITNNNILKNLEKNAKKNIKNIYAFLCSENIIYKEKIISQIKITLKAPILWNNKKLNYREAEFWINLWPEVNPNKIYFKHPFLLMLFHKYLKIRKLINK